jgi:hypothetical protein
MKPIETMLCTKSHINFPLYKFYKNKHTEEKNLYSWCKYCRNLVTNNKRKYKSNDAWRKANPFYHKNYAKKWKKSHKDRVNFWSMKRHATKINAMPKWVDLEIIKNYYTLASDLTNTTGIKHQVDHIVPLQSKLVCGLHCEYNLRIITKEENLRKSNKFWSGHPDSKLHLEI